MNFNFQHFDEFNSFRINKDPDDNPYHFNIHKATTHELGDSHMHKYLQIWYVDNGKLKHTLNGYCYTQCSGDLIIVPPFCNHTIDTSHSVNIEFFYFELAEGFLDIFPDNNEKKILFNLTFLNLINIYEGNRKPFLSFSGDAKKKLEYILNELLLEYRESNDLSPIYLRVNIIRLFSYIVREYNFNAPKEDVKIYFQYRMAIQNAIDYIDLHFIENIHLNNICKITLMPVCTFSYLFKLITGTTFVEYLHYLRIRYARKLLITTNESILSISCKCGFYDMSHFTRTFKKITGYTPSNYRKSYKNKYKRNV